MDHLRKGTHADYADRGCFDDQEHQCNVMTERTPCTQEHIYLLAHPVLIFIGSEQLLRKRSENSEIK